MVSSVSEVSSGDSVRLEEVGSWITVAGVAVQTLLELKSANHSIRDVQKIKRGWALLMLQDGQ
jgi:hypothetical protein